MSGLAIAWFDKIGIADVAAVGGKNASLGEMVRELAGAGVRVPEGNATTAAVFWEFVERNGLADRINTHLERYHQGKASLADTGKAIRALFLKSEFPAVTATAIQSAYRELCARVGSDDLDVAVRSSATAEELPDASFAGQQETLLHVRGERALLDACRWCFASLFTDRAISYREAKGFDHIQVALSVGLQRMVRSDLAGSGVMFSIDTETGFPDANVISAAWALAKPSSKARSIPTNISSSSRFSKIPGCCRSSTIRSVRKRSRRSMPRAAAGVRGRSVRCAAQSNYPHFAAFLVERGIDTISLSPDSFVAAIRQVATAEVVRGQKQSSVEATIAELAT